MHIGLYLIGPYFGGRALIMGGGGWGGGGGGGFGVHTF